MDSPTQTPIPTPDPTPRQRLLRLLRERSLKRGRFTLASGRESTWYVDARATTMTGRGQVLVGEVGCDAIVGAGWKPTHVGGMTLGADPVAYAVAGHATRLGTTLDAFTVRKRTKGHGAARRIEGSFGVDGRSSGDKGLGEGNQSPQVVLVDDTITTGGSTLEAAQVVAEAGGRILGVLVLVDREEGARERLAEAGYALRAVFTAGELLAED